MSQSCCQLVHVSTKRYMCSVNLAGLRNRDSIGNRINYVTTLSTRSYHRKRPDDAAKRPRSKPRLYNYPTIPKSGVKNSFFKKKENETQKNIKEIKSPNLGQANKNELSANSRFPHTSLMDDEYIIKNAVELSKNKNTLIFLHKRIRENPDSLGKQVLQSILPKAIEFAKHPTRKFLLIDFLKLNKGLDHTSSADNRKLDVIDQLQIFAASSAIELAINNSGVSFLKNCLDEGTPKQREAIINQLIRPTEANLAYLNKVCGNNRDTLMFLACHEFASHIIKNCLFHGSAGEIDVIQAFGASRAIELALNKFGSYFLIKCIDNGTEEQRKAIINQLIQPTGANLAYLEKMSGENDESLMLLACHQYASLVIENAFLSGSAEDASIAQAFAASRAIELALNKFGSYFLTKCLDNGTEEQRTTIIDQLVHPTDANLAYLEQAIGKNRESMLVLVCHEYATYVIHNLFQIGSQENIAAIQAFAASRVIELGLNKLGTFFLQTSLNHGTEEQRTAILNQLMQPTGNNLTYLELSTGKNSEGILLFACDMYATHIAQQIILVGSAQDVSNIQSFAASRAIELALNKFGSHFVTMCVDKGTDEQQAAIIHQLLHPTGENLAYLKKSIGNNREGVKLLACHEYASHVIESILCNGSPEDISVIQRVTASRAIELALNKFGNHFVSKCLDKGTENQRRAIITQLIHPTDENLTYIAKVSKGRIVSHNEVESLKVLSCHRYGNYVAKRVLEYARLEQKDAIYDFLIPNLVALAQDRYGKYLIEAGFREATGSMVTRIREELVNPTGKNRIPLPPNTTLATHLSLHNTSTFVERSILNKSPEPESQILLNEIPTNKKPLGQASLSKVGLRVWDVMM